MLSFTDGGKHGPASVQACSISGTQLRFVSIGLIFVLWLLPAETDRAGAEMGTRGGQLVAVDVAQDVGLYRVSRTWDAAVTDADLNGWPDVMISTHQDGPATLYSNVKGEFTEVLQGLFVTRDRHDCDWGDADVDGRPDLYCTIGAGSGSGIGKNELWLQSPSGLFTNESADYGVQDPFGRGRRTVFIDVNHDPYPDLFVGNEYPREDENPSRNRLFINEGGTSFRPAPDYGLDQELGGQCAQAADYDGDGWEDLLVCGQNVPRLLGPRLFRNMGGKRFTDVTSSAGIAPSWASSATLADLDGDGDLDLARIGGQRAQVQMQSGGLFEPPITTARLRRGKWIAVGDADGDGDLDLYLVQKCTSDLSRNLPDSLLLNHGNGRSYTRAIIPQASEGCGDVAAPIDYNLDGRADFIVLNGGPYQETGYQPEGPNQLITFVESTG